MRRVGVGRACGVALSVCIAGAWGCAASPAAPAGAAPAGAKERVFTLQEQREPTTIEEAQAQLEQARAQLSGGTQPTPTTPATGATTESAPGAGGATQVPAGPAHAESSSANEAPRRCGKACAAMTSMRHAVDAICRMAGETDARCTDARKTLEDSETRVTGCGCPPT